MNSDASSASTSDAANAWRARLGSPAPIARAISATQATEKPSRIAWASWKYCEV